MDLNEKLAKKLKEARKRAGHVSAKAFAQKNNVPYTTYAQHESGKRCLSAKVILQYSKLLKIKPNFFLGSDKNEIEELLSVNTHSEKSSIVLIDKVHFLQIVKNIITHHRAAKKPISVMKISEIAVSVYNYMGIKKNI